MDKLFTYRPHAGQPYLQTDVVPGTIDTEYPTTVPQADDPEAEQMAKLHDSQMGMEHLYDCLFDVVHRPAYEYYGPLSAGGKSQTSLAQIANQTGVGSVYLISNPWDNDAEFAVVSAVFGAAGQAILSKDPTNLGPALTATYDPTSLVRGIPFFAAGVGSFTLGSDYWFPIQASDLLYWSVNMSAANTDSAIVTVVFRRRINRHGKWLLTME